MVAGLEEISRGEIQIDGAVVNDVPPKDRDIAMVFQNYALYPHMSVYENMAFGLKLRKYPKEEIDQRVKEAADILSLTDYLDRKPRALSGGERQRVALGRAIVRKPKVFLFDEPLSNLDAKLRQQTRAEISKLHHRLQATIIYVTHDQTEAMVISDRIAVLEKGRIMQLGSPSEVYSKPANKFVAGFMGTTNFIYCRVTTVAGDDVAVATDDGLTLRGRGLGLHKDQEADVAIRPESITFLAPSEARAHPQGTNIYEAEVIRASYVGELIDYQLKIKNHLIRARGDVRAWHGVGDRIQIRLDHNQLAVLPR
jgi:multiple sugar transport system ATP-binding protein